MSTSNRKRSFAHFGLSIRIGCVVLLLSAAFACAALVMPGRQTAGHAASAPRAHAAQGKKPTLRELYGMFFAYAAHIQTVADADAKMGKDSTFYRQHLQKASGLTEVEYAQVLAMAQQFMAKDTEVQAQIADALKSLAATGPGTPAHLRDRSESSPGIVVRLLQERRSTLNEEIASLSQALGSDRTKVFNAYLTGRYNLSRIGPVLHSISSIGQGETAQASPALVTIDEEGVVCDDDDYVCADAQMAYRGAGGEVDLYSYVTLGDSFVDDEESGDVFLAASEVDGYLSTNGGASVPYCGTGASVACPGPGFGALSGGNSYTWYAYGAIGYYYACDDGDGPYPCGDEEVDTQETPDSVDLPKPTDISISPSAVNPGASGAFAVDGNGIISPFQNPPSATVTDQDGVFDNFTPTPNYETGTISIAYTVQDDADTGPETVTVNNGFASGSAEITVNEPAPVITSVTVVGSSTNTLEAGTATQSITLTGENFGSTIPTITISSSGTTAADLDRITIVAGSVTSPTPSVVRARPGQKKSSTRAALAKSSARPKPLDEANQTQTITFTVSVADDATDGDVSFALRANDGASNPDATSSAVPVAAKTPVPQIMIVNSLADVANCAAGTVAPSGADETDVFAGQQIVLCVVQPTLPLAISTGQWQFANNADITGGYTNLAGTGPPSAALGDAGGAVEAADPDLTQPGILYYFVNPGTRETATYHWTLNNGDAAGQSNSADFFIDGPTRASVAAPESPVQIQDIETPEGNNQFSISIFYQMGIPSITQYGIKFLASSAPPTNTPGANSGFMWVQTLTDSFQYLESPTNQKCTSAGYPAASLDNLYPYPPSSATTTVDSPASGDLGNKGESENARVFKANMYLMWNAALPAGCVPPSTTPLGNASYQTSPGQNCTSIPIPLGSVPWTTCADAIFTQNTNVTASGWSLGCGVPQAANNGPALDPNSGFPTWQTTSLTAITVNGKLQAANSTCANEP
jgi:hypothetical protein